MSNVKPIAKTVKRISENDLVDLIDNIVKEAVVEEKKQWIAEQTKTDKTALLENRLAALEKALLAKK